MVKYQLVDDEPQEEPIKLEQLKPPMAPKPVMKVSKTSTKGIVSLEEGFKWLVNNSSFQRSMVEFMKKVVPGLKEGGNFQRLSKSEMSNVWDKQVKETTDALEIKKLVETNSNARNYAEVMKELKLKLEKRKVN